jgi:hypothetical protein
LDHKFGQVLIILPALELLLADEPIFGPVADQEAVLRARVVHGLYLGGNIPLPVTEARFGRCCRAGRGRLIVPGDSVL